MGQRIKDYLQFLSTASVKDLSKEEKNRFLQEMLIQIGFFQHERLIHLIVTVTVALLGMMSFIALLVSYSLAVVLLIVVLLILIIPYIMHYYRLENGVQLMYKYYDKFLKEECRE